MLARPQIRAHHPSHVFRDSAVRIGLVVGAGLSLALYGWIFLANRVPIFDRVSVERNLAAAVLIAALAFIPVLRFFRDPASLLISSLIAWSVFSLTYRTLSIFFWTLRDWYSTFQVFMLGAVLYLIVATLSWIGACIWKARAAHLAPPRHRVH
ncbi:MAG: hypothetical protein M3P45_08740 [Acidobacteriota bacterium]|nr:hypothetical protein [Acidobacteriota bacterium]